MARVSLSLILVAQAFTSTLAALDVPAEAECGSGSCTEAGEKGRFLLQTLRLRDGNVRGITEENAPEVTHLSSSDFSGGTLRLRNSGHYELTEDVEFEPNAPGMSWSHIPPDSTAYPQKAGYFLGFFAAITIEADGVTLDCNGHEIKMSKKFHKLQRFFSLIELGSSPFPLGQGPPQFASDLTTSEPPVFANNVVIKNCKLGLSSHHSIHGNNNNHVTIKHVQMYDFEVAGVALNGANDVDMKHLQIGPSLKQTFGAPLSHAFFLDHMANTLMEGNSATALVKRLLPVQVRKKWRSAQRLFGILRKDLRRYAEHGTGPIRDLVGDGKALPDGSAIYGIVLHRSGVAINRLGFCADESSSIADKRVSGVSLKHINITGLSIKVDQVSRLFVHDKLVMGPGGDVFQPARAWTGRCFRYVGSSFMDAQIAMGAVCEQLARTLSAAELVFYCGGTNVPLTVRSWASGRWSCGSSIYWALAMSRGTDWLKLKCDTDAMSHHNKGPIGLRLGFQADVTVKDVLVDDISNNGTLNALPWCGVRGEDYQGMDTRAVSLAHMKDVHRFDVRSSRLHSTNSSRIFPITGFVQQGVQVMRGDDAAAGA